MSCGKIKPTYNAYFKAYDHKNVSISRALVLVLHKNKFSVYNKVITIQQTKYSMEKITILF